MICKIGDYVTDKFDNIFHIKDQFTKNVVNANEVAIRYATQEEIEHFHEELEKLKEWG